MSDRLDFLIADVSRLQRRAFDDRARTIGVTKAQWRLLITLTRNEGLNQGTLAELVDVEPITLCRMVDRLEESGLVERRAHPHDRRAWQLFLTDKARPLIADLRAMADSQYEITLDGVSAAERDTLRDILERMQANLDRRPAERAHG